MDNGKLPINEDKELKPVDLEDNHVVPEGFTSPREDAKGFLQAYFDGPYERPYRKRPQSSPEKPDSKTLSELVDGIEGLK